MRIALASARTGASATGTAPFNFSCTNSTTAGERVGALTAAANQILSAAGPVDDGWATRYLKAAASPMTEAHADYQNTLTFIATATF